MRNLRFGLGLFVGLAMLGLMLTGSAGSEENGTSDALQGPADWVRVDGQDHDLDEMLSLMRPPQAETLAIFAPSQRWKPFFDKIYGQAPIDLGFYAAIYGFSPDESDPLDLSGWPSFYRETAAEDEAAEQNQSALDAVSPPGELLEPPSPLAVTFKTRLFQAEEGARQGNDKGSKTNYTVIVSLIPDRQRIFFLSLFQNGLGDPVELERLALDWRSEFIVSRAQAEEDLSGQTME